MSFWDPYDRYGRERRRRLEQQRRQAQEEALRRAREEEALRRARAEREMGRPAPPLPPTVLERFEQELAQAHRERDEWADRYKQALAAIASQQEALERARAELQAEAEAQREQLRAEAEAQRERLVRNAEQRAFEENRKTLTRLLEVADNFERVLAQATDEGTLLEGVRLTHRDFRLALERVGVERLESLGQPFDPARHEAVAVQPSPGTEEGIVLYEVSPGYLYRGTLLRPAKVIIAQATEQPSQGAGSA